MPSPVGHSLAGLIAYQIAPEIDGLARRQVIAWYLLAANAPDLDFLPGLMAGDPNRFHHGVSHSSGLALLFAIAVSLLLRLRQREWRWKQFFVFLGLYLSHLILDYLSEDSSPPYGVPLFWPASRAYFMSPAPLFPDIHRSSATGDFFLSLFSAHNLWSVSVECLVLVPLLLLAYALMKRLRSATH
jgi:inner membrane protein